ncbi:hypothetical protein H8E50_11670, partial [bacterium]|nr:hypothetical protein [bacterium]
MFIESSTVGLNSSRTHFQRYEKTEELKVQVSAIDDHDKKQGNRQHDKVALSKEAQKFLEKNFDIKELSEMKHGSERTRKLGLLKNIVEAFTGKKIKMRDFFQVVDKMAEGQDDDKIERHGRGRNDKGKAQYDVQYNRHEAYYEKEEASFNAPRIVRTADGREISFSLDMMLSRE